MAYKTVDEILDFAIANEEAAAAFYMDLADKMKLESMKKVFLSFANEEKCHKAKLIKIKDGQKLLSAQAKVTDLKIGDFLADIDLSKELDFKQALIVAMKAEKAAYKLYNSLAGATDDPDLRGILLGLAQEEAKHKLRFEIEYDDFLYEN